MPNLALFGPVGTYSGCVRGVLYLCREVIRRVRVHVVIVVMVLGECHELSGVHVRESRGSSPPCRFRLSAQVGFNST